MRRIAGVLVALALASAAMAAAPAAPKPKAPPAEAAALPTLADLVKRGQETSERVAGGKGNVWWTTELSVQSVRFEARTTVLGDKRKRTLRIPQKDGTSAEVVAIVEQDGAWYVREFGKPLGKYRPFEAPLGFPNAYLMLEAGDLKVLPADTVGKVLAVNTGPGPLQCATVQVALSAPQRAQVAANIAPMREMLGKMGDRPGTEKYKESIAQLEALVEKGRVVEVDVASGVLMRSECLTITTEITSFSTAGTVTPDHFNLGDGPWKDVTGDPTLDKNLNNLIMLANAPMATLDNAERFKNAADARLVNLGTREVRRIPFRGASCITGCFSRDRRKVYVSGLDPDSAGVALFEVDLSTGANRRIGADGLPPGMAMGPALSPDGGTLAIMMFSPNLMSQVCLVDLKTGTVRKLGAPLDTAFVSWLDDGTGLILITRKYTSMEKPSEDSLARMDLDGKVTVLAAGGNPVVIPGRKKILFEQDRGWSTCDLDGKDPQAYAEGMKGCGFPAVSADGKRVVWMRFQEGQLPQPVVEAFGETKVEALDLGGGFWATPAWR